MERARWLVRWAVPVRLLLDLAWVVELPGHLTLGQVGGAALVAAITAAAAATTRPRWPAGVALAAILAVGCLRASSRLDAVSMGLQLWAPIPWAALCATAGRPEDEVAWRRAAWVPVAISLASIPLLGDVVVNGIPRLVGSYGNVHSHGMAMAVICASAALAAEWPLAAAAGLCALLGMVRASWVFVAVALAVAHRRDPRVLAGIAAAALAAVVALRARWADVWAIATATPPPGGWGQLGSARLAIWSDAVARFLAEGPATALLGRGVGGQYGLHRHLDVHSDWLATWFQLGVPGVVATAAALRPVLGHPLVAAAVVVMAFGNDVTFRPTVALWVTGAAALSLTRLPADPPPSPAPAA